MRGDKPVARVIPFELATAQNPNAALPVVSRELIHFDDSAFAPLTDEEMIEYGFDNPEKDKRFQEALEGTATFV